MGRQASLAAAKMHRSVQAMLTSPELNARGEARCFVAASTLAPSALNDSAVATAEPRRIVTYGLSAGILGDYCSAAGCRCGRILLRSVALASPSKLLQADSSHRRFGYRIRSTFGRAGADALCVSRRWFLKVPSRRITDLLRRSCYQLQSGSLASST
jgi:hypothetical protein